MALITYDVIFRIYITYFEFIVPKYSQICYQFNKYTALQYYGIENFVMVSKNDIAVSLNFGILQSPITIHTNIPYQSVFSYIYSTILIIDLLSYNNIIAGIHSAIDSTFIPEPC